MTDALSSRERRQIATAADVLATRTTPTRPWIGVEIVNGTRTALLIGPFAVHDALRAATPTTARASGFTSAASRSAWLWTGSPPRVGWY